MTDPIKAKIQSLCPDLMELKFGCEVGMRVGGTLKSFIVGRRMNMWVCWAENVDDTVSFRALEDLGDNYEILGSPITLAVVLRAIKKAAVVKDFEPVLVGLVGLDLNKQGVWNQEADNWDQQSEECKQFIGSLLGV